MPGLADIDFDPPLVRIKSKAADLEGSAPESIGPMQRAERD